MEERKTKLIGRLWQVAIEEIRNWHFGKRDKRIWWHGDKTGASIIQGGNPQLRTLNLHTKDFLNAFFRKESKGTLDFGKNPPFWSSLIILDAEINARRKEYERLRAEKYARFLRIFRTMKNIENERKREQ